MRAAILAGLCVVLVAVSTAVATCETGFEAAKQASDGLLEFALKFYEKVHTKEPEKNQFFSPISIALALATLENGANGETRTQIQRLLTSSNDAQSLGKWYQALQHNLTGIDDPNGRINIVNGLFFANTFTPKPDFVNDAQNCLKAKVEKMNFATDAENERRKINSWISNATVQKIPELLKQGFITPDTVAIITNAVYFKAPWKSLFTAIDEPQQFYKNGQENQVQNVPFMVKAKRYPLLQTDKFDAVHVPYDFGETSLIIVLPKQRTGVQSLDAASLRLAFNRSAYDDKQVRITMPMFTYRSAYRLNPLLSELGADKMFSNQADFGRVSDGRIKVSEAVHEAFISVNENGTEAAAATAFGLIDRRMPPPPKPFLVDHPFIYAIVENLSGAVLFLGKVVSVESQD